MLLILLRQRNFALLWVGQLISGLGDWLLFIALPFYMYEQTGSALAVGSMFMVSILPRLLLGSVAGVFVDQWDRKRTMIVADLLRAGVVALLLLTNLLGWFWLVYPLALAQSILTQFFLPAKNAMLPCLVAKADLMSANTCNAISDNLTMLIGPALGGILFAYLGLPIIIVLDAISFLISALLIFAIGLPFSSDEHQVERSVTSHRVAWATAKQDWWLGLTLVKTERLIGKLFLVMAIAMLGQGIINVLWVVYVQKILGGSAVEYGWVQVFVAAGQILGAFWLSHLNRIVPADRLIALGGTTLGLGLLATFNSTSLPIIFLIQFGMNVIAIGFFVPIQTLLQINTAQVYLGRIFGSLNTVNAFFTLVGEGLASGLSNQVGIVTMLNLSAILYFAAGLVSFLMLSKERCAGQSVGWISEKSNLQG